MIDSKKLNELSETLANAVPESVKKTGHDLKQSFIKILLHVHLIKCRSKKNNKKQTQRNYKADTGAAIIPCKKSDNQKKTYQGFTRILYITLPKKVIF